nr:MAG TPA: hypothetical protein [Caudoviricetes sp.]
MRPPTILSVYSTFLSSKCIEIYKSSHFLGARPPLTIKNC